MTTKKAVTLMVFLLFGTMLSVAQDRRPMGGPGGHAPMAMMGIMEDLKLTDDQKKEVQKLHLDLAKQQVAQGAKVATARIELQEVLRADNPDKGAIEKKMNEIAQLGVQSHMQRLNQWFAVNKILNADQQKIWKHVLETAGANREGARGMMMNRRSMRMRHPMGPNPRQGMEE